MEAKELRIGNYVNLIADGHKHQPDTFQWSIDDYEYYETVMFNILPIPLTEEWLLKFGFKYRLDTGYNGWYSPNILGESIRIFKVENGWFKYSSAHNVIKNVHQLQNLYFALTNKELTIK